MASLVSADRVQETTATTGSGTITTAGAVTAFQSFSAGVGTGNWCDYTILSGNGTDWESGMTLVTVSGGVTTLSRDIITASSNSGSAISLTGTSTVFSGMTAARGYGRYGRALKRPSSASFSWTNQGTSSVVDHANGPLTWTVPDSASAAVRMLTQAAPGSTPYTLTAELETFSWSVSAYEWGIGVIDNAGKMLVLESYGGGTSQVIRASRWTNTTLFSAVQKSVFNNLPSRVWMRINNDGVHWNLSVSHNGSDWLVLYTETLTAFLASTISGLGLWANVTESSSVGIGMNVSLWSYELATGAGTNVQWT